MKKAFQISIAGILFSIEEDAYARLDGYISSVKRHFAETEGRDEIVRDIESRIAEQLLESKKAVISIAEVETVIASMGKVEDFEDGIGEARAETESKPKKLYRDADDSVIAGVCSGLARYFGIDPLWTRIAFVILTFILNGFPVFAYIVLWIVMPEARTAAQKLEMSGTPVNLETIRGNIQEKIGDAKDKHGSTARRILAAPFVALKAIVAFIRKAIVPIVLALFGIALGLATLFAIVMSSFGAPFLLAYPERLADFPIGEVIPSLALYGSVISAYLVVIIPTALLFLVALRLLRLKTHVKQGVGLGFLGVWLLAIASLGASVAVAVASYQEYERTSPLFETETRDLAIEGPITGIRASFGQRVTITESEEISLAATGRRKDLDKVEISIENGILRVSAKEKSDLCILCDRRNPDITLAVPSLSSIQAEHGSRIESESLESDVPMSIELGFGSRIDASVSAPEIRVKAEHGSKATLRGEAQNASYEAGFGSAIDAADLSVLDVEARAEFGARIRANASGTLDASAEDGGTIEYSGDPVVSEDAERGGEVRKI